MKYTLAITLLLASVQAFDVSEGPTKADNGEDEPAVIGREADISNGAKASGWTNPLGWADDGANDDDVLLQTQRARKDQYDGDENTVSQYDDMHQYKKFDWGALAQKHRKDQYDGDESTVSQYDDMHQYKKFDWGQGDLAQKTNIDSFL